jgi:hypothetical protein
MTIDIRNRLLWRNEPLSPGHGMRRRAIHGRRRVMPQ